MPTDACQPGRRLFDARDDIHQGGLSAPAAAYDRHHLSGFDAKIEALQGNHLDLRCAVDVDEALAFNDRLSHPRRLSSPTMSTAVPARRMAQASAPATSSVMRTPSPRASQSAWRSVGGIRSEAVLPNCSDGNSQSTTVTASAHPSARAKTTTITCS